MARPAKTEKGKRITIFLHENQVEMLDEKAKKAQMSRSKFIEFSCGLGNSITNVISENYGKGGTK